MLKGWRRILAALLASATLTLFADGAFAQKLPPGVTQATSVEGITEYRLANGLKVLLFPDVSKPTVVVNITYLVGSRHENYGETGMAHLLEHLLFKGTPKHPNITQEFTRRGMRFNGTTWLDRTNYYELFQASDDNLKWALNMEADRMVNSFIAKKDLDSEMTVVRNEFEAGENSPFGVMLKRMQSIAYDWHSYGRSTIGNRSDIENVEIANLQAFYRTYYRPDNAVLLVAGKFDTAKTLQWITEAFGKIAKPKQALPKFWTVEPTQDGERSFTVRRKGDVQIVFTAYKIPSGLHADNDAMSFVSQILGDTPNGRLHKQLVETGKAAQVFAFPLSGYAPGLQILGAVVKKGEPVEPVRDALIATVEDFHKKPPTKEEMDRVRIQYANAIEKTLNDHERIGVALSEAIAMGDWRLFFQDRETIGSMSAERVTEAAKRYFKRDNRVVGLFHPEDQPQRVDIPAAPSVAEVMKDFKAKEQGSVAEAFDPSQDNLDKRTQRSKVGGIDLALLPKKNRGETVAVALDLHWGDEKTLFGKQTVASLTRAMLVRGNAKYTRQQLADEFSRLKISGDIYRFETTREHLPAALRLIAQVLKEPTFPAEEFEQLRKQRIVAVEAQRSEPAALAGQALAQHFNRYPKGDWRAPLTIDEQLAALQAVTLDEVKAYHKAFYGASKGEMAIVGDFDAAAIAKVVEEAFAGWNSAMPYTRVATRHFEIPPARLDIDTPDKENGTYLARINIPMRDDDPDFPAMMIANYLFGSGGLNSRLIDRIRQKDGLSYGGHSSLHVGALDKAGQFVISAIAAPQNLARLETAIKEELARAAKDGFTAEEIARAKSGILQQRLQTRAQDGNVASGWTGFLYLNRTWAWSKQIEDKISAATVEQVNTAFRKAIDPARLTVVVAGDHSKMKAAVKP
ncbi:MAG TPA: pitrilysin family protein [Paucimonas sp.]|nr:pitrilysin family protein [Paucimonas sp.]